MDRAEFLDRCANAYDAGLIRPDTLAVLDRWTDMVMRLEGGQVHHFADALEIEDRRTRSFAPDRTLASDKDGYDVIQLVAILRHPCQECATSPSAWWTRSAFCEHRKLTAAGDTTP